ncbi:MAG: type II secretion system protein [Sedimentisphaerales bacterium]|nr:type II secretion system protein [Sedimentisphaerales bacterium]
METARGKDPGDERSLPRAKPRGATATGFTLIELLVVIAIIAVLLAILIPSLRAVRERAQRAICLANLRQLTTAWLTYADEYGGRLVRGELGDTQDEGLYNRTRTLKGWVGGAFFWPKERASVEGNAAKGALWPYLRDIDVYRCPAGWKGHPLTYAIFSSANGARVEGTYMPDSGGLELTPAGRRVGRTVLRLTRLTDITSPGPAQRAVFIDHGHASSGGDFFIHYLYPKWYWYRPPAVHHAGGTTLSFADGHTEYWKWRGKETVTGMPRKERPSLNGLTIETLEGGDHEPKTEDGMYDLQRLQTAVWGRLGYAPADP